MQQTLQLLDYMVMQEDAVPSYHASGMVLGVHSNASYLSKPKSTKPRGWTLLPVKQYNCPTKQWGNSEHSIHH
jgi:hypothetical protein